MDILYIVDILRQLRITCGGLVALLMPRATARLTISKKELGWPATRDMSQLRRLAITRSEAGGSARWMRRARFGGGSSRLVYFSPGIFCLLGVYTSLYHPLQEPE